MSNYQLVPGDTIFANHDIYNDGSFPDISEDELLVKSGTRGVIVNHGHMEENEKQEVFLVQFELDQKQKTLGPPIGCWPEDIRPLAVD
jgi:nitrogen fixation protein NifZ